MTRFVSHMVYELCTVRIQVLANLLETEDVRCRSGALRILACITSHPLIRKRTTQMGGIELLVRLLSDKDKELQLMAAETMANLAKFRSARTIVRRNGGIPRLVDLLDIDLTKVKLIFATTLLSISFSFLSRYFNLSVY